MAKVTIAGAGNVGATCAHALLGRRLADVVLLDIDEGLAIGKALDLSQSGAMEGFTTSIKGTGDYRETAGSEVVIVTAGLPRCLGMSREELLEKNAKIVVDVVTRALDGSPDAKIIVVTNPLDLMTYLAYRVSGLESGRVVGMGGLLDSARFKRYIATSIGCLAADVDAMVIGAHADSMVPLASLATVGERPLASLASPEAISEIIERTKGGGAEIVSYLRSGSAFYAPGVAAAEMAGAILEDEGRLLSACALATGAYGVDGIYIGLPVRLGASGVVEVVEVPIETLEREALSGSAAEIEAGIDALERRLP